MNTKKLLNILDWILPINLKIIAIQSILKYKCVKNHHQIRKLTEKNLKFKNIHNGQRCFILGTGPSINTQSLVPLQNEICISVSAFFLHPELNKIKPLYHVLAPFHHPLGWNEVKFYHDGLLKNYNNETTIFLGYTPYFYSIYNYEKIHADSFVERFHYINYCGAPSLEEKNHQKDKYWDITNVLFAPRTVIYSAIQLAAYMGCSEIYLLGCDHDYLTDVKRVTNHHFYQEEEGISDVEHLSAFTSEKWFYEYYIRWKDYRLMGDYLTKKGIKIYNATEGGMLDVFPRVNLSDILSNTN